MDSEDYPLNHYLVRPGLPYSFHEDQESVCAANELKHREIESRWASDHVYDIHHEMAHELGGGALAEPLTLELAYERTERARVLKAKNNITVTVIVWDLPKEYVGMICCFLPTA